MPARRLLAFILLNVIVSAMVVLAILYWWDSRQSQIIEQPSNREIAVPTAPTFAAVAQGVEEAPTAVGQPAEESSDLPSYTVQSGDTLGKISREFDVSVGDILAMNGIEDANFLQVGQVLIIPVGGIPTVTPLPTETPSPQLSPTPISAELPDEGEAVVDIAEIVGVGDPELEAVSVVNNGSRPVALLGWRLIDSEDRTYTFGQVTLFGEGAAIMVHTGNGQEGPSDLYWGFQESVWQPGETATLVDAEGTVRATFDIGTQ